jgi:hypothetical protein
MSADEPRAIPFPGETERVRRFAEEYEQRVEDTIARERVVREARRRLDAEERGGTTPPVGMLLQDWLVQADPAIQWRIEHLQPAEARMLLAAQHKAGKTTFVMNLVRSLMDGDPFLGRYTVSPVAGRLALIDNEMSERQLRQWLRAQHIQHADRVMVWSLRGQAGSFDPRDPANRAHWVQQFRAYAISYVVLDCLRPVLDALGLDEHTEVGPFLVAFDTLLRDAGAREALVVHHMGHVAERSRGDSRLRDWPDLELQLVRQTEDSASPRFFKAYGRDVDVRESRLIFDASSRHLTIGEGSRRDETTRAALEAVIAVLTEAKEPPSVRGIQRECEKRGDHPQKAVRAAIKEGVRIGKITVEDGQHGAHLHRLADDGVGVSDRVSSALTQSDRRQRVSVSAPIGRDTTRSTGKRTARGDAKRSEASSSGRAPRRACSQP